ncbi:MAG: hypothetical protein KDD36_09435 [Flavobacteriales bacterium]|nr:hypothetical protein [Flavobacteriales bacterium]
MRTRILILAVLIFVSGFTANAQMHLNLHFTDNVPGTIHTNPAFFPKNNGFVGLPVFSSMYTSITSSGWKYSDLIRYNDKGDLAVDVDHFISKLKKNNLFSVNFETELFSIGIRRKSFYFSAFVTERINMNFAFPKDLIRLAYNGNGAFLNETASLDGIGLNMTHFRDYSLGVGKKIGKVNVGMRLKFLYGKANVTTQKSNVSIFTDSSTTYHITAATDVLVNTSLPFDNDNFAVGDYILNSANAGTGFDFGAKYRLNDKWSFALSAVDMGYIYWRDNIHNYSAKGSYTFTGLDISKFSTGDGGDPFQEIMDSVSDAFDVKDTVSYYRTNLNTKLYASTTFKPNDNSVAGFLIYTEIYNKKWYPSFTVYYSQQNEGKFNSMISYSVINGDFRNLGFGATVRMGPFQTYCLVDNLIGVLRPQHTKAFNVHMGMYIVLGARKYAKPEKPDDEFDQLEDIEEPEEGESVE